MSRAIRVAPSYVLLLILGTRLVYGNVERHRMFQRRISFERSQLRKFQLPDGELDYSFAFFSSPLGRGGGGMLSLLQN